jgi:hypothetical protein
MATQADVRRIALSLPETIEEQGRFAFAVRNKDKLKGICWVWLERIHPKKARVPNPEVLAVRVANLNEKDLMIASEPEKFFTEPHYNGYPAVLVRLARVGAAELRELIAEAWRIQAPKALTAPAAKKASTKKTVTKSAVRKKAAGARPALRKRQG